MYENHQIKIYGAGILSSSGECQFAVSAQANHLPFDVVKIMDTPYGNIVKNLISEGACVGVSTRGMGSLEERSDGTRVVKDDFYLATAADIVADPSAPDAFVRGIMEGKEWVWDNGIIKEVQISQYKETIKKSSKKNLEENMLKTFNNFLTKL